MNILILMGRGIEGTGQTRTAIEIFEYFKQNGHNVDGIANNEKKWGRVNSQNNEFVEHNFKKSEYVTDKKYDRVIIASVPAKNYSEEGKEHFTKLLEGFNKKITQISYVQVDHKIHSINRNYYFNDPYLSRFFSVIDVIVTHDLNNDFIKKFLDRKVDYSHIKIKQMMFISYDFDNNDAPKTEFKDKYNKLCYFIGRSVGWKGPWILRDFHHEYLKKSGYTTFIEGIELSIGILKELYISTKPERIQRKDVALFFNQNPSAYMSQYLLSDEQEALIFGPYVRKEALARLSQAKFGMFFTYIGEEYGGPIENTLMEIIASGTVPVVLKEFYESAKYINGRLTNYAPDDVGFILYDRENPLQCIAMMNEVGDNKELYVKFVKRAQKWAKANLNRKYVIGNFDKILTEVENG